MVREAEQHRVEDQRLREDIDARNELDAAAYRVERALAEHGDSAPAHERSRAEMLVQQAREAVEREVPAAEARELTSELRQVDAALSVARPAEGASSPDGGAPADDADDDVVDADFDRN